MPHPEPKPDYRYKYIKDFLSGYLFIAWGTLIAIVTFADHQQNLIGALQFRLAVISLGLILFFHLIILFFNFLAAGSFWDYLNSDGEDRDSDELTRQFGNIIRALLLVSFIILFSSRINL